MTEVTFHRLLSSRIQDLTRMIKHPAFMECSSIFGPGRKNYIRWLSERRSACINLSRFLHENDYELIQGIELFRLLMDRFECEYAEQSCTMFTVAYDEVTEILDEIISRELEGV